MDIHSFIIHFPIALVVVCLVFELLFLLSKDVSLQKASFYCLLFALLGGCAAYVSGLSAAHSAKTLPHIAEALNRHKQSGINSVVLLGVLLLMKVYSQSKMIRVRWLYPLFLVALLLSVAQVLSTGFLGGELVFKYGAGANH